MFLTQSEANEKECRAPSTVTVYVTGSVVAGSEIRSHPNCVGSRCMHWRWEALRSIGHDTYLDRGFCGLAGRP